jgi:hypothetical protein
VLFSVVFSLLFSVVLHAPVKRALKRAGLLRRKGRGEGLFGGVSGAPPGGRFAADTPKNQAIT